jgi:hypothetical protein
MKSTLYLSIIFSSLLLISLSQTCEPNQYNGPIPAEHYKAIVEHHNKLRNTLSLGNEKGYGGVSLPSAANLPELVWDDGLAALAQSYAHTLVTNCQGMVHNENRKLTGFATVGENLYMNYNTQAMTTYDVSKSLLSASEAWYEEVKAMNTGIVAKVASTPVGVTGHYVQQVWWETMRFGCGFAFYKSSQYPTNEFVVCNYGESLMYNEPLYTQGTPCSQCSNGEKCSTQWPGLCNNPKKTTSGSAPSPAGTTTIPSSISGRITKIVFSMLLLICLFLI